MTAGTFPTLSLCLGVVVNIKHIKQTCAAFRFSLVHFIKIIVNKPAVIIYGFKLCPVGSACKGIIRRITEKRRSEHFRTAVCFLYKRSKINGFFNKFGAFERFCLYTAVR